MSALAQASIWQDNYTLVDTFEKLDSRGTMLPLIRRNIRISALCERDIDKPVKERKRLEVHRPATGTRLMREWNGHEHHVSVLEDGFEYKGQRYTSLSAIASKITGARWNGLVFSSVLNE